LWDQALADWRKLASDPDAIFDQDIALDCAGLEPQITWGTDPSQVIAVTGRVPDPDDAAPERRAAMRRALEYMALSPGTPIAGLPVDRVFIGSCANARLPDLALPPRSAAAASRRASSPWWCRDRAR
jgi:3-isopropylmalate/(R)-2-methylmalate dehydratase large subunit